jgi:hypothetical protein
MTLMVALAMLAGLVLLAVVVHGAWQARREQPRLPQMRRRRAGVSRLMPTRTPSAEQGDLGDPRPLPRYRCAAWPRRCADRRRSRPSRPNRR